MIKTSALFDVLDQAGFEPELVEEDTEITIICPLCADDLPRLYVSADTGAWTCFHCHEQGGLHRLLMAVCEMDASTAYETSRTLRTNDPTDYDDYFELSEDKAVVGSRQPAVLTLPLQFHLIDTQTPAVILKYLERRHVSPQLAAARGIGYAITGRYAWRVIVPVKSDATLYTFVARTVLTQCPNCMEVLDDCTCRPRHFPKVLTPTTKDGANPRATLFNFDAVRSSRSTSVVVVEGVFDALRLPSEAVALLGSSASATQVSLISGLVRGRECILALDGDEAGYKGALKVAEALTAELVPLRVAVLPEGADPGSMDIDELHRCLTNAQAFVL